METKDKVIGGLIGLVTILAAFGGNAYLNPEQIDKTYVCELNENLGIFDRLSGTSKTGYYWEGEVEKRVSCRVGMLYGKWIPIKSYCEDKGVSIEELLKPKESEGEQKVFPPGTRSDCTRDGCKVIN